MILYVYRHFYTIIEFTTGVFNLFRHEVHLDLKKKFTDQCLKKNQKKPECIF